MWLLKIYILAIWYQYFGRKYPTINIIFGDGLLFHRKKNQKIENFHKF